MVQQRAGGGKKAMEALKCRERKAVSRVKQTSAQRTAQRNRINKQIGGEWEGELASKTSGSSPHKLILLYPGKSWVIPTYPNIQRSFLDIKDIFWI